MRIDALAHEIGAELSGDGAREVAGVATLDEAGPADVTFLSNPRYATKVETTRAGAIIVGLDFDRALAIPVLRASDPYLAMARALACFHRPPAPVPGVHATAVIDASAQIGEGASIGAYCVIAAGARIGARARLAAHVVIGEDVEIGDDFVAHPHASVRERRRRRHA